MGEHHALGETGGAAGVVDADHSILVRRRSGAKRKLALFEQRFVIVGDEGQLLQIVQDGLDARQELRIGDQDFSAAMIQYPGQLGSLQSGIQHHEHGSC